MLLFTCQYNPNVLIDAWKRLTASAGKGAHLGSGFIGCGEFQRFVQVKNSQFGLWKRLTNRKQEATTNRSKKNYVWHYLLHT
jgi:hypothetical protein